MFLSRDFVLNRGSSRWLWCIGFGLLMGLSGCQSGSVVNPSELHKEQFFAFGTLIEVTLYGVNDQQADVMLSTVVNDFAYLEKVWQPWQAGSLGRVNQLLPLQGRFSVSPAMIEMLSKAQALSKQSEGYFNPAIGQLVKLWGFHQAELPTGPPPAEATIRALVAKQPQMSDISIERLTLKSQNEAVLLDFGGFAKGVAVEKVLNHLRDLGAKNMILSAGGDLGILGSKGGEPWHIGIRHPTSEAGVFATLDISGEESVFTSGDYERFYDYGGQRYHHILNPLTGYPANDVKSVTVVHASAPLADAAATALFVAGADKWYDIARKLGLKLVMLIDGQGEVHISPQMQARITFQVKPEPVMNVSEPL